MNKLVSQVSKFVIIGGTAGLVKLCIAYSLTEWVHLWYMLSVVIGISVGMALSFLGNKWWTFKNKEKKLVRQGTSFLIISIIGALINITTIALLTELAGLWYMFSACCGILTGAAWNFTGYKLHSFKKESLR